MLYTKHYHDIMRKSYQDGWQQSTKNFDHYLKQQQGLGEKNNRKISAKRRKTRMVQQQATL